MKKEKLAKELLKIAEELLDQADEGIHGERSENSQGVQKIVNSIVNSDVDVRIFEPTEKASWGSYIVIIGNDAYEMDDNAHLPNGVNIYYGRLNEDFSIEDLEEDEEGGLQREVPQSEWGRLPYGLLQGIIDRIEGLTEEVDEDDEFED
jgi:hypothetical protein